MGITKDNIGPVMAMLGLLSLIAIVFFLMFNVVPEDNRDLFNVGLMALISAVSTAFGYYLGGSHKGIPTPGGESPSQGDSGASTGIPG